MMLASSDLHIYSHEEMNAAASSPDINNKVSEPLFPSATLNGSTLPQRPLFLNTPKQSLRGLNKPKCIKCGNVARSRCPFQSCKSCCSKAENPCYIHVLKQTSTLPDKPPPSSTPSVEQPPADVPSTGASWRLSSLRQLSTNFVNNLRTKKPLTRKDAVNINKWIFSKLKEHIKGNIESENNAFQRYLENVSLLEETFSMEEAVKSEDHHALDTATYDDQTRIVVSLVKVTLKSNAESADSWKERVRSLVDRKLRELKERELVNDEGLAYSDELDAHREPKRPKKMEVPRAERTAAVNDLVDKLSKARSDDDLRSCLELKLQLFTQSDAEAIGAPSAPALVDLLVWKHEPATIPVVSSPLPKTCTIVPVDQNTLSEINTECSSLGTILEL